MDREQFFRIVFWALLALILAFNRILPAVLARKRGARLMPNAASVKKEGIGAFIVRAASGAAFFVFLLLYALSPPFMDILLLPLPEAARWAGVFIAVAGLIAWIASQAILDRNWSPQLRIQAGHEIVRRGPYRYLRHPIYSSMILWAFGTALFTANWFFVAFFLMTVILLALRAPREEKLMEEEFGDDYRAYERETGRFFPRIAKGGSRA